MFDDWIEHTDASVRKSWEAPNLPEESRWWADGIEFDKLPKLDKAPEIRVPRLHADAIRLRAAAARPGSRSRAVEMWGRVSRARSGRGAGATDFRNEKIAASAL